MLHKSSTCIYVNGALKDIKIFTWCGRYLSVLILILTLFLIRYMYMYILESKNRYFSYFSTQKKTQKTHCVYSLEAPHLGASLGWSGVAKVSCILCLRGVQLILAYSWARTAILVADKGLGGLFYFFCFFTFIPVPLFPLPLFHLLYYLFSPSLWETTQNDPQGLTCR